MIQDPRNRWYALPLNGEPWKSPSPSFGRRNRKNFIQMHKDQGLVAYQKAVQEQMTELYPDATMVTGDVDITFYFWRNLAIYQGANKIVNRNHCDATNLQKALEDALIGVLYADDRDNVHVESYVMEQGSRVEPLTVIRIRPCVVLPNMAAKVAELKAEWPTGAAAGFTNVHEVDVESVF